MDPQQPSGSPAPQAGSGEAPVSLTRDDVSEIVNKAIGARNKLFEKQIGDQLSTSMKGVQESIRLLGEQQATLAGGKGEKGKRGKDGDEEPAAAESAAFKSLQRQFADMKAENDRNAALAKSERDKSRDVAMRQKVGDALAEFGIKDPVRIKHALHHLVDGEKRVGYAEDDDSSIVYRDSNNDVLDLATGLKAWAKSDDGKHFLPPTGARGSGDRQGGNAKLPNGKPDVTQLWGSLAEKLLGG